MTIEITIIHEMYSGEPEKMHVSLWTEDSEGDESEITFECPDRMSAENLVADISKAIKKHSFSKVIEREDIINR